MFKVTVTTTATSLYDLALNDTNRDALLKQINSKRANAGADNLYIQNKGTLDIAVAGIIIPTIATGVTLSAGNENTYHMLDMKEFYLISSGSNADVVISGL